MCSSIEAVSEPEALVPFGQLLRRHGIAAGLSQEVLAERSGLSANGVSHLQRGARQRPYFATIERIPDALGLADRQRREFQSAARVVSPEVRSRPRFEDVFSDAQEPRSSFIGREQEIAALTALLSPTSAGARLVTLSGPAGTGKIRRAQRVTAGLDGEWGDRRWFVPRASIRDPALVQPALPRCSGYASAAACRCWTDSFALWANARAARARQFRTPSCGLATDRHSGRAVRTA